MKVLERTDEPTVSTLFCRSRSFRRIFSIAALWAVTVLNASRGGAEILSQLDFEDGQYKFRRQYQDFQCSKSRTYVDGSLYSFVNPGRTGQKSLQLHVRDCDERAEIELPREHLPAGKDLWIAWSYYFPQDFFVKGKKDHDYTILFQANAHGSWGAKKAGKLVLTCGNPGNHVMHARADKSIDFEVMVPRNQNGKIYLGCKERVNIPLVKGRWNDFVMHVKFSSGDDGFMELWMNGKKYVEHRGPTFPQGFKKVEFKLGAYTGHPGRGDRRVLLDHVRIGGPNSSYQEVSPGGSKEPGTPSPATPTPTPSPDGVVLQKLLENKRSFALMSRFSTP